MSDSEPKDSPETPAAEPELIPPQPEPGQPEPAPEPPAEPAPPEPEVKPADPPPAEPPAPDPAAEPEPQQKPQPEPPKPPAPQPEPPAKHQPSPESKPNPEPPTPAAPAPQPDASGIPAAVLALTDAELKIAAAYYLRKHQKQISQKGVKARQTTMQHNLDRIEAYVHKHKSVQIPRLCQDLYLAPGQASHYLQILVKQHKIKAEGHAAGRLYRA